ncbi:hypothetical protein CAC42_206 [Sphaceloma murrayae]|uniref:Glyoxalase-like domain-containing protein n=1 Tax=Sphaceloma murrayae TaxID=2082308 RepID=A0A2K1QN99_9PEZI|nr:hypothetical protein CAC42_206 [Sphaceloma murrayae]
MAPKIDHIIVGLPYGQLQDLPRWLTDNFTIAPGGRHADEKTENKLIVFKDGSYIELIAFIDDDPEKKKGHWWGEHGAGYIDWAFTSNSADDIHAVNDRIDRVKPGLLHGVRYRPPQPGGRTKPDGNEIKWKVTFPEHVRRGEVPFWCHDVTPREMRVPKDDSLTTHPCGALGVGRVTLVVPDQKLDPFQELFSAVFDSKANLSFGQLQWDMDAVNPTKGVLSPELVVQTPFDAGSGSDGYATVSQVALLTDTIGIGQSRDTLLGKLGDADMQIDFVHGKQA